MGQLFLQYALVRFKIFFRMHQDKGVTWKSNTYKYNCTEKCDLDKSDDS